MVLEVIYFKSICSSNTLIQMFVFPLCRFCFDYLSFPPPPTSFNPFTHNDTFGESGKEAFRRHCGKRRNCLYKQFLLFPTMFSALSKTEIIIFVTFNLSFANAFNLVWSKILLCGCGFKLNSHNLSLSFFPSRHTFDFF